MDESIVWSTQVESQFFELKSALSRSNRRKSPRKIDAVVTDILDTLSAMANADGGELVVGIEDDGLATGVPHSQAQIQIMWDAPSRIEWVVPPLGVARKIVELPEGERLLYFAVSPMCEVHRLVNGRCLLRICDANIPLSDRQVPGLEQTMPQRYFERQVVDGATLDDLNFGLLQDFWGDEDVEKKLRSLGLLVAQDNDWVPCLVALLLFGKTPKRWHANHGIVIKKWAEDEDDEPVFTQAFSDPLIALPQQVFDVLKAHIPCKDRFPYGSVPIYPDRVWQEAIVNAILHRDYAIQDQMIEICMFADRVEIRSPGLPPRPITANRLNRARGFHLSRNPILYRTWISKGDVGEVGQGTALMRRAMAREGLAPPVYDRYDGAVLRFTLHNRSIYNKMLLTWLARYAGFNLSASQQRILVYARLHGYRFTVGDFAKLIDVGLYEALESVTDLVHKGVVRTLKKESDFYRVLEPLYVASDVSDFLVLRLAAKGRLANRHVRHALGVRRHTARKLLRIWCDEKWIVKTGKSAQTVYEPGVRFAQL